MNSILIKANDGFCQTTLDTIKLCNKLYQLLNVDDNIIELDMPISSVHIIIDYLQGYSCKRQLKLIRADAIKLDLFIDDPNYVIINIRGKIFYKNKQKLQSNLDYFKCFFEHNKSLDPDYSSVLIDRSPKFFSKVINYLSECPKSFDDTECEYLLTANLIMDLKFYGYHNQFDFKYKKYEFECDIQQELHLNNLKYLCIHDLILEKLTDFKHTTKIQEFITTHYIKSPNYYKQHFFIIFIKKSQEIIFDLKKEINNLKLCSKKINIKKSNEIQFNETDNIIYITIPAINRYNHFNLCRDVDLIEFTCDNKIEIDNIDYWQSIPINSLKKYREKFKNSINFNLNPTKNWIDICMNESLNKYTDFYIQEIKFVPEDNTDLNISHIIIKSNDDVVAIIPNINLIKNKSYVIDCKLFMRSNHYYCLSRDDNITLKIYFQGLYQMGKIKCCYYGKLLKNDTKNIIQYKDNSLQLPPYGNANHILRNGKKY